MAAVRLQDISVLCVGASSSFCDKIKTLLNQCDITQIHTSDDERAFFKVLADVPVDVVVIADTPDFDGVELCHTLRTADSSPDIRLSTVILLTEKSQSRVISAVNAGTNEVVMTPITPGKLLRRIRKACSDSRTFIVADDYVGPERRSASSGKPAGARHQAAES